MKRKTNARRQGFRWVHTYTDRYEDEHGVERTLAPCADEYGLEEEKTDAPERESTPDVVSMMSGRER